MAKKSFVTQKQIAKVAGVSQTAVSLVLSGRTPEKVSNDTRQRVLEAVEKLGYVPQAAATSLVSGRSNNIGFVLIQPHYQVFKDPYVPNILTGLMEICHEYGYRIMVENIGKKNDVSLINDMLKGGEVDGIILNGLPLGIAPLVQDHLPIVSIAEHDTNMKPYSAMINHPKAVRKLIQHLVDCGSKRIACITYTSRQDFSVQRRLQAYKTTLEEKHLHFDEAYVRHGNFDPESGYSAMQSLLELDPLPDAVYGMNDLMALGAMKAIVDAGLRVPEDIAVVGYDDMRFAEFTNPALTTMRAPEVEQGRLAGQKLIDLLQEKRGIPRETILESKLIIRESCGYNQR